MTQTSLQDTSQPAENGSKSLVEQVNSSELQGEERALARYKAQSKEAENREIYNLNGEQ